MGFVALGVAIDSIQNQNLVNNLNLPPTSSNVEKQTNTLSHSIAKNKDDDIISVHLPAFGCITTGGLLLGHITHRYHSVQALLRNFIERLAFWYCICIKCTGNIPWHHILGTVRWYGQQIKQFKT